MLTRPTSFNDREGRARFIAEAFSAELSQISSVLDVGCWRRQLSEFIPDGIRYVGVDVAGEPDAMVDLEEGILPFDEREFNLVVSTEVLEHLDNPYHVVQELFRCSDKYVLISLPNSYEFYLRRRILLGQPMKFYGLPASPPEDRHKWFFSIIDARRFIRHQVGMRDGWIIERDFVHFGSKVGLLGMVRHILISTMRDRVENLFGSSYWCLMKRQ